MHGAVYIYILIFNTHKFVCSYLRSCDWNKWCNLYLYILATHIPV